MVGLGRVELPTSPLSGVRSNHLSYRPRLSAKPTGGADRDRTGDPLLAKQVLSQLSYSPTGIPGAIEPPGLATAIGRKQTGFEAGWIRRGGIASALKQSATLREETRDCSGVQLRMLTFT